MAKTAILAHIMMCFPLYESALITSPPLIDPNWIQIKMLICNHDQ